MKVHVNIDESLEESNITINCKEIDLEITRVIKNLQYNLSLQIKGYKEQKVFLVEPNDIVRFFAQNGYIYFDTLKNTYRCKERLKELVDILNDDFIRISNSEIVNIKMIKNLDMSLTSAIRINFINDTFTYVSRRFIKSLKNRIGL